MLRKISLLGLVAILLLGALAAFGQAISGDLVGVVSDKSGAVVANATVVATNQDTGVKLSTTTNASGEYRFSNLLPGAYSLGVSAPGFQGVQLKNVPVQLNHTVTENLTLGVGQVATTVEVTEATPPLDTTTTQLQSTYDSKQIQDLPSTSVGSGVLNLSLIQAGVGSTGGIGAGSGPSIGGQRPRNNNFTIEGVDNNNKGVTGPDASIPNDAVENFTVLTNQFSPEFGHSTGGQFNQTIKSGTNNFHGRAYEYFRNRNLNAVDTLLKVEGITKNPRFDDNRFGGQVGGPIFRNKLFFFVNYTYEPIGQSTTPSSVFAPTAAGYATLLSTPGVSAANVNLLKSFATAASACTPPAGGCPALVVGGKSIQVGNFPIVAPAFTNNKFLVASMDYNLSASDQIRGRYVYNQSATIDANATLPVFYTPLTTPNHVFTFGEYHTFSPTVTNEFRLGFNRNSQTFTVPNTKALPTLDQFPNLFLEDINLNLGPDPNAPQFAIQNLYQMTDNVSWVHGHHTIKFGIDAAEYISPQNFTQRARGDYDYTDSALYFTDKVPDDIAERSLGFNTYYGNQHWFYSYVNDIWKIRPNLSLNLGLRHEFLGIPLGWNLQGLNKSANAPGLITFNVPVPPKTDFAPRVGFAWSPQGHFMGMGDGTTSVRAGFGMGYDVLYDNIGILSLPPQLSQTSDCPGGPGCASSNAFLAGGGIKPFVGVPVLNQAFCANVIGIPVSDDAHCARLLTAGYLANGTPTGMKYPKSAQWNFGFQHLFGSNYTWEERYVGTAGWDLNVQNRLNRIASVDATHNLPLFTTAPTQAQLDALTTTLTGLTNRFAGPFGGAGFDPAYAAAGFDLVSIVGFVPYGHSSYHGLQSQLNRRFSNGLQFQIAHTWSHTIDNSTADFFSTVISPRRPQDFRNLQAEKANSPLDHAHRFTAQVIYDVPWFKQGNWLAKNLVGNWEIAPIYTWESGQWADIQSGQDANLNGDSAGDRAIFNPGGTPGTGSDVTALKNSGGATVAYLVKNPSAQWYRARPGMLATSSRNTYELPPINNWDLSLLKRFNITEHTSFEFAAILLNTLNHHQFIAGSVNDIASIGQTGALATNLLRPSFANFEQPKLTFSSNPRTIQLGAKFIF